MSELASGGLLAVLGIAVLLYARTFPVIAGQSIGPGLFPGVIGAGLACCGLALMIAGRRAPMSRAVEWEPWIGEPRAIRNSLLVAGSLAFYVLVAETAGFFITGFVFLTGLFLAFGVSRRATLPLALATTFGLHVMFYTWLRVPLPWGWLEGFAW